MSRYGLGLGLGLMLVGCVDGGAADPGRDFTGPGVAINVAALNLQGVGDVVWDLEVRNGASTPQVVWQRRITSSAYGDSAGSASYVGPCDADSGANLNVVRVWVVGLYEGDITAANAGAFNSTHDGVTGTPIAFQNPTTPATPLTRSVTCAQNGDVPVQFDVALMRPAQQGFFDIAVNFNNIFCSAKFDCCADTGDGVCAASEDLELLFESGGARGRTFVLGFACTAGAATDVVTELYLDDLALDCDGGSPFAATVAIDPSGAPGNQCTAGSLAACPAITTGAAVANTYLYQVGVYRGAEQLTSSGVNAQKVYWNVALGVKPTISACHLKVRATADDAANADDRVDNGTIAAGTVYPYVQWDLLLDGTCASESLSFGAAAAAVKTAYTGTGGGAEAFANTFAPSTPPVTVRSCKQILDAGGSTGDGPYTVDVDGPSGPLPALEVYCDMTGGGFTLVANLYDSAGDDVPNTVAAIAAGWQQTGSGAFATTLTRIARDIGGSGSAALAPATVKGLWDAAGATTLRMCLVSTANVELCRTSGEATNWLALETAPVGTVNTTLAQWTAANCTGVSCQAAYTYGRLAGLPGSHDDFSYAAFPYRSYCVGRTVGAYQEFGDQSYGFCEHDHSYYASWRGVWHGWGNGISFRPSETGDDELGNYYGANPSTTSYGFRLYVK